jgi:uncharacterized protein
MQVVVDTNIWISALINPAGPPARVLRALEEGRFGLVAGTPLLSELGTVLQRPRLVHRFTITPDKTLALLRVLRERAELVEITGTIRLCRDPRDDMVIETALAGRADTLVSRDDDLKRAPELIAVLAARAVSVLTVHQFLEWLEGSSRPA